VKKGDTHIPLGYYKDSHREEGTGFEGVGSSVGALSGESSRGQVVVLRRGYAT
jgi:hypothetical protein